MNTRNETIKYAVRHISNTIITLYLVGLFSYGWTKELNILLHRQFLSKGNYLVFVVYAMLVIIFMNAFGAYKLGVNKISTVIMSQALACFMVNAVEIIVSILMIGQVRYIGRIVVTYFIIWIIQCVGLFLLTWFFMRLYFHIVPAYKMLMVYGEHENRLKLKMQDRPDKYIIEEEISCFDNIESIIEKIRAYDAVLINDIPSDKKNSILKICFDEKKRVYFTPKISDIIVKGSEELNIFDTPLYLCRNLEMSMAQKAIKRTGDIIISLVGIVLTGPIMLITAFLIHKYDGGPVLYKQTRCTLNEKEFSVLKFRSMIVDAEKDGKARLASENDDRITPIGKFIRATRIDELPQFFNVLKGDMSIVGPRPERPEICKEYYEEIPEFAYRLKVKAGLTGYAQVYGKYNTTSYDKLKLDLIYVEKCSIWLDIQLIMLTLRVIFTKEATEGIDEGKTNASTRNG